MKFISSLITILFAQIVLASNPTLSFFNEQNGKDLKTLFSDSTLIPTLQKLKAEIRLSTVDLSPERIEVVKKLNEANIPVVAWLLLPKEEGYWFHSGNAKQAHERYLEVKKWAKDADIDFVGIGIDIEIDYNEIDLLYNNKLKFLKKAFGRLYEKEEFLQAKKDYQDLVNIIKSDGYSIESYYVPYIRIEAHKGRTALQQASRIVDLETDKDIPMLYTSYLGNPHGTLKVLGIDQNIKNIALGTTGGGSGGFEEELTHILSWEDLAYDMRVIGQNTDEIHLFCLESIVERGFLSKLVDFDFNTSIQENPHEIKNVKRIENGIQLLSFVLSYPTLFLIGTILLIILLGIALFKLIKQFKSKLKF